jgi:hypothetical protein
MSEAAFLKAIKSPKPGATSTSGSHGSGAVSGCGPKRACNRIKAMVS